MVLDQIERYNKRNKGLDEEGHLSGAIIASLRAYEKDLARANTLFIILFTALTISAILPCRCITLPMTISISIPSRPMTASLKKPSSIRPQKIVQHMYAIKLSRDDFEADLAREIARIANISRKLGYKLRAEKRSMTKEEAYVQLGHSASLLKAVLRHYNK